MAEKTLHVVKVLREIEAWDLGAHDWHCDTNERARVKGGRALYENVWTNGNRRVKPVRLGRVAYRGVGGRLREVTQWVDGDVMLEIVQVAERA